MYHGSHKSEREHNWNSKNIENVIYRKPYKILIDLKYALPLEKFAIVLSNSSSWTLTN